MWITIEEDSVYDPDCKLELKEKVEFNADGPRMGFKGREKRKMDKEKERVIIIP